MTRHVSDYTGLSKLALATTAHDLHAAARAKDLKEYNVPAADVEALATAAASFDHLLTAPQLAIDAAKIKRATARFTLSALNVFLRDDLRAGMELFKDTHRDAYDALREASQVDDARYRKGKKNPNGDAAAAPASGGESSAGSYRLVPPF